MWATAQQLAWKLAPGLPNCLHTLSSAQGGGNLSHERVLWAKEILCLLTACCTQNDELRVMAEWEWTHSLKWIGCSTDASAALELCTWLY